MPSPRKPIVPPTKNSWGGRRPGAGRKPKGAVAGVSHAPRPTHKKDHPVFVTLRVGPEMPSLRRAAIRSALHDALAQVKRPGFRVIHSAIEARRLSFIVEADGRNALTTGCQGLSVRIARALNRTLDRDGRFFSDRYESRPLTTPADVARTLEIFGQSGAFSSLAGGPLVRARTALLTHPQRRAVGGRR
jgi:hypothetical protein